MDACFGRQAPRFAVLTWFTYADRRYAEVRLDQRTEDFAHLLHQRVVLDGVPYLCVGVERFLHSPPWFAGELIGLVVEPEEESDV